MLATQAFPECHTGEEIAKELKRIVNSYSAREKVSAVVHDQAANMELCHRILSQEEGWESIFCSAHCLQLCLKERLSITAIDRLLGAAQKLVGHFHHSVVATEVLKKRQDQMGDTQKKIVQDVATRWNSSLHMLECLLVTRWPITAVLSDEAVTKRSDHYLDRKTEQWELAEEMVKVLQPFAVATIYFSYEENVSLSCVLPVLYGLQEGLKEEKNDHAVVAKFKEVVKKQIQTRWALQHLDVTSSLLLASAVDPWVQTIEISV